MCKQKALEIRKKPGDNDRANAATTIAVVYCKDGKYYCTSNDVSQIAEEAIKQARHLGISPIGHVYISQRGAGFHAEMWAVIQAMHSDDGVANVLGKVGASRACCKNCTDVLNVLTVPNDTPFHTIRGRLMLFGLMLRQAIPSL